MKVLVTIKHTIDYRVKIRLAEDGFGVQTSGVKMGINPFDEIALEEAIRLKESDQVHQVTVLSVGDDKVQESLRTALAFGADNAVHIKTDKPTQPLGVAKVLQAYIHEHDYQLLLMGKQAIDNDANQTGQMVAALLGWSQATFACKLELLQGVIRVDREIDGGIETIEAQLPAVVTSDLRLNTPRFISLPNIMKAKKKTIEVIDNCYQELLVPNIRTIGVTAPPSRTGGRIVDDVDQLVSLLKTDGVIT